MTPFLQCADTRKPGRAGTSQGGEVTVGARTGHLCCSPVRSWADLAQVPPPLTGVMRTPSCLTGGTSGTCWEWW